MLNRMIFMIRYPIYILCYIIWSDTLHIYYVTQYDIHDLIPYIYMMLHNMIWYPIYILCYIMWSPRSDTRYIYYGTWYDIHDVVPYITGTLHKYDIRVFCCCHKHINTLQHTATHCNTLQRTAAHCNTQQHTTTHCTILHHTATHCNTLLHVGMYVCKSLCIQDQHSYVETHHSCADVYGREILLLIRKN